MVDATAQLALYNGALLMTGSRRIANLSVNEESRRALDDAWAGGDAINEVLEQGFWKFALRKVELSYDAGIVPTFGYRHGFQQPDDMVHWYSLCTDEFLTNPVVNYEDTNDIWYCDLETLYLRYVSNDTNYGNDYDLWPETFKRYVEGYLAKRVIKRLTDAKTDADDLEVRVDRLYKKAKSKDAMKEPSKETLPTDWQRARNNYGSRWTKHPWR